MKNGAVVCASLVLAAMSFVSSSGHRVRAQEATVTRADRTANDRDVIAP